MAQKTAKRMKRKPKLSAEAQDEVRFLKLAIANHTRCMEGQSEELRTYFQLWIDKNNARLNELTGQL